MSHAGSRPSGRFHAGSQRWNRALLNLTRAEVTLQSLVYDGESVIPNQMPGLRSDYRHDNHARC